MFGLCAPGTDSVEVIKNIVHNNYDIFISLQYCISCDQFVWIVYLVNSDRRSHQRVWCRINPYLANHNQNTICKQLIRIRLRVTLRQIQIQTVWHSYNIFTKFERHWSTLISWQQFTRQVSFRFNPFSAGTAFMLLQTGWIQASCGVTRRLAWDPTCLLLTWSFPIKNR